MCVCMHSWELKNNMWKSVLSFHHVDSRNWTLVLGLGCRHICLLNPLADPAHRKRQAHSPLSRCPTPQAASEFVLLKETASSLERHPPLTCNSCRVHALHISGWNSIQKRPDVCSQNNCQQIQNPEIRACTFSDSNGTKLELNRRNVKNYKNTCKFNNNSWPINRLATTTNQIGNF